MHEQTTYILQDYFQAIVNLLPDYDFGKFIDECAYGVWYLTENHYITLNDASDAANYFMRQWFTLPHAQPPVVDIYFEAIQRICTGKDASKVHSIGSSFAFSHIHPVNMKCRAYLKSACYKGLAVIRPVIPLIGKMTLDTVRYYRIDNPRLGTPCVPDPVRFTTSDPQPTDIFNPFPTL